MDLKKRIGARIAALRKARGMTQDQLACRMEVSIPYLSGIERGKENPTLNTLINLAQALNLELSELFHHIDVEDPERRKALLTSLLSSATDDQLKQAIKVLTALFR